MRARRAALLVPLLLAALGLAQELPAPVRVFDPRTTLDAGDLLLVENAVAHAEEASGQKFTVVLSRPKEGDFSESGTISFERAMEKEWSDRNLVIVLRSEWSVTIHTAPAADAKITGDALQAWRTQIDHQLTKPDYAKTIARAVREIGDTIAGHPPKTWTAWRHPFLTLAGGQDATPLPLGIEILITLVLLTVLVFIVRGVIADPVGFFVGLGVNVLGAVIGGAVGGGGGGGGGTGGGSSFSGGGGSSGGGGANGSW